MTILKEQTDAKVAAGRQANPDFMQGIDDAIAKAKSVKDGSEALDVGKKAPRFELPNPDGTQIASADLLAKGPMVVTFYRGSWCPYCNLQLRALQARMDAFKALGAELVAITPQVPDGSLGSDEISQMDFTVLSDHNATIAQQYGVAWKVPEFMLEHMKVDRQLDLEAINNGNGSILPIPATFVINRDGDVVWRYVDVDYRMRSEPDDVLAALKNLT